MAKKKQSNVYGETDMIKKPASLMYFKKPDLCNQELAILEEYFYEISKQTKDQEFISIPRKRIEELLQTKEVKADALATYLKNIGKPVMVKMDKGQFSQIYLIDRVDWIDGPRRSKILNMRPSQSVKELYETIGDSGKQFFRYKAMISEKLTTPYARWFANYIITNMYKGTWSIDEDNLREMMNCYDKVYVGRQFRYFVLKPAVREINESGIINIDYTYTIEKKATIYTFSAAYKDLKEISNKDVNDDVIKDVKELEKVLTKEQYDEAMKYIRMLYSSDEEHHLLTKYQRAQLHATNKDSGSIYNYMLQSLKNETGNG